ncbi:MAG TPA: hypothetical protein VFV07_05805 [Rhizomicrobium sp.]|nr:hypothetical protein [Rhizomicrobium sp.]
MRAASWRRAAIGCSFLVLLSVPAAADGDDGGFFGRVLNSIQQSAARAAWQNVDPGIQSCLQSRYNLDPATLASQGIGPGDPRVSPDIDNCQQIAEGQPPNDQPQQDPQERLKELTHKYGAKAAKKIAAGNIDIGFTQDEVVDAWGNPDDRKGGAKGKEIWVYGQDNVTFTRGKVSAVGH